MPITTTLDTALFKVLFFFPHQSDKSSFTADICPTISCGSKFLTNFWVPVWQKEQLSVHPIWEDMQIVPLSSSGIKTVSNSPKFSDLNAEDSFIESLKFVGQKKGYVFKMDSNGLGYYLDYKSLWK